MRELIFELDSHSIAVFVTHVPLMQQRMQVINFNKNLLFVIRSVKRKKPQWRTATVGLHHWCIAQGMLWAKLSDISQYELNMLIFLIVQEVLDNIL